MERRKDNKGRVLRTGESQRKDLTYMFRYKDIDGKRKCVYAPSLNELREKEKEINGNLSLGIYSDNYTLNELVYKYLDQNIRIKQRTRYKYKVEYDRWVSRTWLGKKKIKSIVKSDIVKFYKELSEDKGYSDGTIRCVHKYISGALNMAFEDDLIRRNYATQCIEPYSTKTKRDALTKEETDKFLSAAEKFKYGKNYLLIVKLMLLTGLRIGEATGLTWNDIDLKEKMIDINHQFVQGDEKSRTSYHIDVPKTESGKRKIPMSNDVYELLKFLKQTTYFDAFKFSAQVDGYSGFIVHTRTGLPVLAARVNDYIKKVVAFYNEEHDDKLRTDISCHICRHTFCTRMAELNINPHALQKIAGHSSYNTTSNIYISVDDSFVNEEFYKAIRGGAV